MLAQVLGSSISMSDSQSLQFGLQLSLSLKLSSEHSLVERKRDTFLSEDFLRSWVESVSVCLWAAGASEFDCSTSKPDADDEEPDYLRCTSPEFPGLDCG